MKGPIIYMFFLVLLALLAGSCGPARVVTGDIQRDSILVHVRDSVFIRDTLVLASIPQESDKAVLPDTDTSRLQTGLAESEAFVKNGRLHHTLRNRSERLQQVSVQYRDKVSAKTSQSIHSLHRTEVVEVEKELNGVQKTVMTIGWTAIALGLLWILWKLRKFII